MSATTRRPFRAIARVHFPLVSLVYEKLAVAFQSFQCDRLAPLPAVLVLLADTARRPAKSITMTGIKV